MGNTQLVYLQLSANGMLLGVDLKNEMSVKGNAILRSFMFDKLLGFSQVIDTNYKDHLIVYTCLKEDTPGMKSEYVMIAARDPNLTNKQRVQMLEVAN